jgi:mono/diheme cytochrome c family protein
MKSTASTFAVRLMALVAVAATLPSCIKDPNSPGYEYTPDMYRSPAVEAYIDYGEVRDTIRYELMHRQSARLPVDGTVPYTDNAMNDMPYTIPNNQDGYELAGVSIKSPITETEAVVAKGKAIYENFCVACHGKEGLGNGPVVEKGGHPAPGAYNGSLKNLPEGKMFHTLTYGKGVMGSHASQLTKEERWQVIAYVKVLQKK